MEKVSKPLSIRKRLSQFGHRLCVKHDFLAIKQIRGKTGTIRRFYDFWAPLYDLIYRRSSSYLDSAQHVVQNFVRPGDQVLDLGAGTGLLTLQMLPKALSIVSYDLHQKMLNQGRNKVLKAIRTSKLPSAGTAFCQGDALSLPFSKGSFDLVASSLMLVYLNEEQKAMVISEARRVLKPGGRLTLMTFQGEIHNRFTCKEDWIKLIKRAGFDEPSINDFSEVFRTISVSTAK